MCEYPPLPSIAIVCLTDAVSELTVLVQTGAAGGDNFIEGTGLMEGQPVSPAIPTELYILTSTFSRHLDYPLSRRRSFY